MSVCAIVPVRASSDGKTRLAGVLTPPDRAALVRSMLERVLDALRNAQGVDRILIVTSERGLVPPDLELLLDGGDGMNAAVAQALAHVRGAATAAIVIAADVPEVTTHEIERLVAAVHTNAVVVVPDHRATGTNALGLQLPALIEPHFGPDSCATHVQAARNAGATWELLRLPGVARDVDEPGDLGGYVLPSRSEALALVGQTDLATMMDRAAALTLQGFGRRVSYSRKVFIPLTQLCRDVCHYCTFAGPPRKGDARVPLTGRGARDRSRRRQRGLP